MGMLKWAYAWCAEEAEDVLMFDSQQQRLPNAHVESAKVTEWALPNALEH